MRAHEGLSMYHRCSIFQGLVKGLQVFFCIGPPEPPWRISESARGFIHVSSVQYLSGISERTTGFFLHRASRATMEDK